MRISLLSVVALIALGGCNTAALTNNQTAYPTNTLVANTAAPLPPGPPAWLDPEPLCSGTLTQGEWLVCDRHELNELHRRLAHEWMRKRQNASAEQMQVLEDQLYALLSERDACQTAPCVAAAYRRYLGGSASSYPSDSAYPADKSTSYKSRHGRRYRHGYGHGRGGMGRPDFPQGGKFGDQSCTATDSQVGVQRLVHQCTLVNSGRGWQCSPRRSCDALKAQIEHGCRETYRKPGFCKP